MRLRSIRWTLLFWYAVILVGALAALGFVLLTELERNLYRDADAQLALWAATLKHAAEEYPAERLAEELAGTLPSTAEFEVRDADGQLRVRSGELPASAPPWAPGHRTVGHHRILRQPLANGDWAIVAKNVEEAHHDVRDFLVLLLSASAAIAALALVGGWILVGRALVPVHQIAATAHRISAENLNERIDVRHIQNELGDLAHALNDCFDRLEAAIERQVRFTADASHELRTPLAIVMAHLELAEADAAVDSGLRERLATIRDAARRMQAVVEGLLTLARADSGSHPLHREEVELAALLEEVKEGLEPLARSKGVALRLDTETVTVFGDRDRLREIATNLGTNAVHYNHPGGTVTLSLRREEDHARLQVRDTGIGIAPEDQERVFHRFFRVEAARTRDRGGSGLGLAIVRHLVALHHGEVSVESRPGTDTVFTVTLPRHDPAA